MFHASEMTRILEELEVSHIVWVPDSTFGTWEDAFEASPSFQLVRVCREGEAWPLAAGLQLGGAHPIVIMQSTGFFESGDALRNVLFDLACPIFAMIGVRNWLLPDSPDSARRFLHPLVKAWRLNSVFIESAEDRGLLAEHYRSCRREQVPGVALLAEGQG